LTWKLIKQAMDSTAKLTTFVVFILVGARVFSLTFYGVDGHKWVEHLLTDLPGGQVGFLIVVNILVFVLAFFLDFFELAFIIVPLLGPVAEKLGIDLIWFGILLAVNMQTSFMHPPFGFALFYLRSVAPTQRYKDAHSGKMTEPVTTGQIYWGAVPFVVIQMIMVALIIAFPALVSYDKPVPAGEGGGPVIDIQKMLQEDALDAGAESLVPDLKRVNAAFLAAIANPICQLAILPKEAVEGKPINKADIVGTGPYKFVEWIPDRWVRIVRFPDYKPEGKVDIGGLGGAVAEVLGQHAPTPMKIHGIQDCYGESGPNDAILEKYGMTPGHIAKAAKALLERTR